MPTFRRQGGALSLYIFCVLFAFARAGASQTAPLPAGWSSRDIGAPATAGSAESSAGTITVRGAGAGIDGSSDQFHFAYQQIAGDVDARVRIASLERVHPWAEAGLMIRDSLAADSKHAFVRVRAAGGLGLEWRDTPAGESSRIAGENAEPPIWVRLVRQGTELTAYSSPTGTAWTLIGTASISFASTAYVGLAVASRDSDRTAQAEFTNVDLGPASPPPSPLPSPWVGADVGSPALAGNASASSGTFTVTGSGTDIYGQSDQFHFVYQPYAGDTDIVARVGSLQSTDAWSKAGVMIRASLTDSSQNAFMLASGGSGWAFQRRLAAGVSTSRTMSGTGTAPGWVRLVREGNLFSAYTSQDGSTWTLVGTDLISMPATIYVGLAVTSHSAAATATATFGNVLVRTPGSTNQPPTVAISSPAAGATYTAPATISVSATAGDVDGSVTQVDFFRATNQLIGSDTTNPFSVTWNNVPPGTYSLTAVATDNAGGTATSPAVVVTVGATTSPTKTLTFAPSADHATNVTSYTVQLRRATDAATATPVATQNLGKPGIVGGQISQDITTLVDPLPTGSYYAVVVATGPGGSTPSSPSTAFSK